MMIKYYHFYSHIPCGMWLVYRSLDNNFPYFYSHIPCGMWLLLPPIFSKNLIFLLTHPVWDVTAPTVIRECEEISTHTSRVGCDYIGCVENNIHIWFLLTHPVWDVTLYRNFTFSCFVEFLLTHPVWDVTFDSYENYLTVDDFYSHIPCGMWPGVFPSSTSKQYFYSHIPCGMWLCCKIGRASCRERV